MVERGSGARLALEPIERLRVARDTFGKKFQGDAAAEL